MKMLSFAKRNSREILRDPLTVVFSLGFPVVLLLLLTAIQANVPVVLFEISRLTPGITETSPAWIIEIMKLGKAPCCSAFIQHP